MFHNKTSEEVLEELNSTRQGLTKEEAEKRLKEYGLNKLPEAKAESPWIIFLRQFQSPLIYILMGAALIVFYLGEAVDGLIILAVLLFNAIVGAIQEGKAQNTLLALKKFVETSATVLRENKELIIPDSQIVPGDVIFLEAGEKVPADARVIVSNNLKLDQAALTGESMPVYKITEKLRRRNLAVAEQKNMVFKGTYVVAGNGQAMVVSTGMETAIGGISRKIAAIDTEIPLKTNIRYLSRLIIIVVSIISAALVSVGYFFEGKSLIEMFKTAVALSVSIIPEGLPIVMTLVLASGVWRMAKSNALVKRLQAVEALGQAKIIAVDKTGTLTKNELTIKKVFVDGKTFEIGGLGYEPRGDVYLLENYLTVDGPQPFKKAPVVKKLISAPDFPGMILAGKMASFCSDARISYSEETKSYQISGDPTEAAILVFSQKAGFQKEIMEKEHPLIQEIPFNYKSKYHATVRKVDGRKFLTAIGAPESVLSLCKIPAPKKKELESVFYKISGEGMRVLAFAYSRRVPETVNQEEMPKLTFGGFFGIRDTLRPEVKEAMARAREAGIKVVMITGDHKVTAEAIAEEAGIYKEGDLALTGEEIDKLTDEELEEKLPMATVFARVTPEHKLKIIQVYRKRGEIIAMTGDGVNDAPPLVAADLGVAMGKIGTEVAKEASDIVLLDDNFGTIVSAVEEGRSIYKTIKKVMLYLFSTSLGEVLTISTALFFGYPLPLLAGQIIWLNFVTDGFLDVALAMEPKEKGLLKGKWKKTSKYLVDSLTVQRMCVMALPMAAGGFFIFQKYLEIDLIKAFTMCLTTLAIFQWFNVWNCRSEDKSIFQLNPFSNKWLLAAMPVVVSLQALAVYNSFFQKILHTTSLDLSDWLISVVIAFSIIIMEEIRKLIMRRNNKELIVLI